MAPAKTELERLANAFRHSWLDSERCVEFLEGDVVRRQNAVVLGEGAIAQTLGWRQDQSPLNLADLVGIVSACFRVEPVRSFLTISVGCALVGELLVTVHTARPGTTLHLSDRERPRRLFAQAPFEPMRNTLCHPGMLPDGPGSEAGKTSFAALLRCLEERYSDQQALIEKLGRSRHEVAGFEMARWCLHRIHELGQFEIVHAVLDEIRRRKVGVDHDDEVRVEKSYRVKQDLETLLERYLRAKSVSDLFE